MRFDEETFIKRAREQGYKDKQILDMLNTPTIRKKMLEGLGGLYTSIALRHGGEPREAKIILDSGRSNHPTDLDKLFNLLKKRQYKQACEFINTVFMPELEQYWDKYDLPHYKLSLDDPDTKFDTQLILKMLYQARPKKEPKDNTSLEDDPMFLA